MPASKRALDLLVSIPGIILISPLLLIVSVLVRLFLGSPVLFRQLRPGFKGRPFYIYKFRTMTDARDPGGRLLPDAARLTRLGRFLRLTSLDELPQLFNVLRGEMSLVGPRPLMMEYLPRYTPDQMRRHDVYPGMTGWTQVRGRNSLPWEEKFKLDLWYVDHRTFWLDVLILILTLGKVIRREGISQPGQATTEYFMGNKEP
jgi:sugar transferase EpsL